MRRSPWRPTALPRGARRVAGESAGETPRRLPGAGVELLQLRDYVSGDALSRIDWKATARRGTLVSREYSEAQHLEILLVIDAGRGEPRARGDARSPRALYANVAARARRTRGVDRRPRGTAGVRRAHARRLPAGSRRARGDAAAARARDARDRNAASPNPVAAAIQVRRMLRHRGLVVWLTDLAEPARNDELMQALKALVPRHQPIVAAPHAAEIARLPTCRGASTGAIRPSHSRRANIGSARRCRWRRCASRASWCSTKPDDRLDRAVLDAYLQLRRRRRSDASRLTR